MEVATGVPWEWTLAVIPKYTTAAVAPLWLTALAFELLLRLLMYIFKTVSVLPPFFFIAIPPVFYIILCILQIPIQTAHTHGWFFDRGYVICARPYIYMYVRI